MGSRYGDKTNIDSITDLESDVNEQYAALGGTLGNGDMIEPNHMGNTHHAIRNIQVVLGANPEGNKGSVQQRLDEALTADGDVKKIGTKEVDEVNIGDDKVLVYKAASDKLEYEDKTLGVAVSSVEGTTGDIDLVEGNGIASISKTGDNEITIEAEVTQAELDAVDAKTGMVASKTVDESNIDSDKILVYKDASGKLEYENKPPAGVTDHGALTGKGDDDHPQYHNDARGDTRYHTKGTLASAATGEGAALIGVEDAESHFNQTTVEGILTELAQRDLQHIHVSIPGALTAGRQIAHKVIIPCDCDLIGTDAITLWCGTPGSAQMTVRLYHYRPLSDPNAGGDNIGAVSLEASSWSTTGDCSFSFNTGDGLVFDIAGASLPEDLTISLIVRQR